MCHGLLRGFCDVTFIVYRATEDGWSHNWKCLIIPNMELILASAGGLLTIVMCGAIAMFYMVNLKALHEWRRVSNELEELKRKRGLL